MKKIAAERFFKLGLRFDRHGFNALVNDKAEWSALDVLRNNIITNESKLRMILRDEFIDESTLHEFACLCAEDELKKVSEPHKDIINAIAVKRNWIQGKADEYTIFRAKDAAENVVWNLTQIIFDISLESGKDDYIDLLTIERDIYQSVVYATNKNSARYAVWDTINNISRNTAWLTDSKPTYDWAIDKLIELLESKESQS